MTNTPANTKAASLNDRHIALGDGIAMVLPDAGVRRTQILDDDDADDEISEIERVYHRNRSGPQRV